MDQVRHDEAPVGHTGRRRRRSSIVGGTLVLAASAALVFVVGSVFHPAEPALHDLIAATAAVSNIIISGW